MAASTVKVGDKVRVKDDGNHALSVTGRVVLVRGETYTIELDAPKGETIACARNQFEFVEGGAQEPSMWELDLGDGLTGLVALPDEEGMRALARRMASLGLQKEELRKHLVPAVVAGKINVSLFRTAEEEWDKAQAELRDIAVECTADDISKEKGSLGKALFAWEKRQNVSIHEEDRKVILTRAEAKRQAMGGSPKESTMSMFGQMVQDDAKEIALRLAVREARKLLSSLMTEYLFSTVQREHGETDEEYAARSKTFKNSVSTFMSSDAGFGILSYVVGAFWPMVEEMVPEGEARELGQKIAREIRVSGGVDAAGDFVAKVVKPMIGFVVSSASHAGVSLMDKVASDQKKATESLSGVRANPEAVDHRDEEIAALKAKLLESETQRGTSTEKRENR